MSAADKVSLPDACRVCGAELEQAVYASASSTSLTSLCTVLTQPTIVWLCDRCAHVQTPPLDDLDEYYRSTYRILLASDEEDQLYEVRDGRQVFRAEHQAATVLATLDLAHGTRLLDYGAAKGATARRMLAARSDLRVAFFDVSDMYVDHWRAIVPESEFATFETPADWHGAFDAVVSFFMLEHVADPAGTLAAIRRLLTPSGQLFLVVPNLVTNVADLVVVDHVNHFTSSSLRLLMTASGFVDVGVDGVAHEGAWVVTGRRADADATTEGALAAIGNEVGAVTAAVRHVAQYWTEIDGRLAASETAVSGRPAAIYGAGFYGSFIHSRLASTANIEAFVDQNPYLQGTVRFGLPVVAPADLPADVHDILVGLNPSHAREIMAAIDVWHDRSLTLHFM
jgi:2-polyprenyl-3-methyl-5-hydroxy-6-metoxy-1,4-benzoquinol methylase